MRKQRGGRRLAQSQRSSAGGAAHTAIVAPAVIKINFTGGLSSIGEALARWEIQQIKQYERAKTGRFVFKIGKPSERRRSPVT